MPTPQLPGFGDIGAFIRWKKSIDYKLNLLFEKLNNVLANTGLSVPGPGVTQVDGSLIVQNGEAKSGNYVAGSAGWHLDHAGNAEFNDLTLRGGIIGNDALTNPISPVTLHADASNFPVTVAGNSIMSITATVPAGYTKALLVGIYMSISAQNTTAASDFLYPNVHTSPSLVGWQISSPTCPAGSWTSAFQQGSLLIPGLTAGATVVISGQVSSAFGNWSAVAQNEANLDVAILWMR